MLKVDQIISSTHQQQCLHEDDMSASNMRDTIPLAACGREAMQASSQRGCDSVPCGLKDIDRTGREDHRALPCVYQNDKQFEDCRQIAEVAEAAAMDLNLCGRRISRPHSVPRSSCVQIGMEEARRGVVIQGSDGESEGCAHRVPAADEEKQLECIADPVSQSCVRGTCVVTGVCVCNASQLHWRKSKSFNKTSFF